MTQVDIFFKPGVNPSSMDPKNSGDALVSVAGAAGQLYGVIDGAWSKGFEKYKQETGIRTDMWSSQTAADIITYLMERANPDTSLREIMTQTIALYHEKVEELKQLSGYQYTPNNYSTPEKSNPQSAGALVLMRPDGSAEICQWADCYVGFQFKDNSVEIITPDQVNAVKEAVKNDDNRVEVMGLAYQSFVREKLLAGVPYGDIRAETTELARAAHSPTFLADRWAMTDASMSDAMTGAKGFGIWRDAVGGNIQSYYCELFMNNAQAPMIKDPETGLTLRRSWGMITGEQSLLDNMTEITLSAEQVQNIRKIHIGSDGTLGSDDHFPAGNRVSAFQELMAVGQEDYYQRVLKDQFYFNKEDAAKGKRQRFADDVIPMDNAAITITLDSPTGP